MLDFKSQAQLVYEERIIMGITRYKGEVEGNKIDSCSVLVAMPLDISKGNALGFSVVKIPYGDSSNFDKFQRIEFPATMQCAFQSVATGSGKEKTILRDMKPVQQKG
ncbi:MAG: hypothetical protein Q4B82_04020 [Alysiella sp.]|uniref:hypothetical protein n=1 Tax=Alysiella sp. TaxID=1872483 RepID=UPI0026DD3555|nr:hypothetical protein [Alysiella sp.]MDO4433727.1 hypothetical protein [Alysiella sp.]